MTRCRLFALFVFLFLFPALASSQTGLTSLRGTVTDPSGALVAGAEVSLDDPATGFHATHPTDPNGAYEFPQIPPGTYTVTVNTSGFGKQSKQAELLVSQPATINFVLSVQASTTTVEVSDSRADGKHDRCHDRKRGGRCDHSGVTHRGAKCPRPVEPATRRPLFGAQC